MQVANAAGAALSQVAAVVDTVYNLMAYIDEAEMKAAECEAEKALEDKPDAINEAKERARKPFLDKARHSAMCEAKEKAIEKIKEANANPDTIEV